MKRLLTSIAIALTVPCFFTACPTLGELYTAAKTAATYNTSAETADQIISDAEKTADIGDDTVNTFLKLDYENRVFIKAHALAVHTFAQKLRHNDMALNVIIQLRTATKTFKDNRTTDNQANLQTLIATVKQIISDTKANMAQANALTP